MPDPTRIGRPVGIVRPAKGMIMPKFIIETTIETPAREFWQVEAADRASALEKFEAGEVGTFLWDEVTGDETERNVEEVHAFADLAGTVARYNLAQEAPAMVEALRELVADATGAAVVARNQCNAVGDYNAPYVARLTAAIESGRAILARIDGEGGE